MELLDATALAVLDLNEPVDLIIFIGFIIIVVLLVAGWLPWRPRG